MNYRTVPDLFTACPDQLVAFLQVVAEYFHFPPLRSPQLHVDPIGFVTGSFANYEYALGPVDDG
jgi:hypothetical protein